MQVEDIGEVGGSNRAFGGTKEGTKPQRQVTMRRSLPPRLLRPRQLCSSQLLRLYSPPAPPDFGLLCPVLT
jgi:hypothetical protein